MIDSNAPIGGGQTSARTADTLKRRCSALKAQHDHLAGLLAVLRSRIDSVAVDPSDGEQRWEVLRLVGDLESQLPAHFAFEEKGGYLSDELTTAPRLGKRAKQLQSDHRQLEIQLAHFARHVRAADRPARWAGLIVELHDFIEAIRRHELEESRLIQEAVLDDLGGGS